MSYSCQHCPLAFIGPGAVIRWSEHMWAHLTEVESLIMIIAKMNMLTRKVPS